MARIHHATLAKAKKFGITLSLEENDVVATAKDGTRLASGLQGNKVLEEAITKQTGHPAKKSVAKTDKPTKVEQSQAEMDCRELGWAKKRGGGFKNAEEDEASEATTWEELAEELELTEGAGGGDEGDEGDEGDDEGDDEDSDADQRKSGVKHKYKELYKPHGGKCGDDLSFQISEHVCNEDGSVDRKKLERFARANDAWKPAYATLVTRGGTWNGGMARMNVSNIIRGKVRRAVKAGEKFEIEWA